MAEIHEKKMIIFGNIFGEKLSILGILLMANSHSARRPRTLSGRSTLGSHESLQGVLIRRGRRKDVAQTSRPNRTYE